MTDNKTVHINILSSNNIKDPIVLLPNDENHPITKAAINDALIIKVDEYKMMQVEEEKEDGED